MCGQRVLHGFGGKIPMLVKNPATGGAVALLITLQPVIPDPVLGQHIPGWCSAGFAAEIPMLVKSPAIEGTAAHLVTPAVP